MSAKRAARPAAAKRDRSGHFDMTLTPEARAALEKVRAHYRRQGLPLSGAGAIRLALIRLAESLPSAPHRASVRACEPVEVRA